jgi:hypothetical protein
MTLPATQTGEARVRNYAAEELLQEILQELRAIKYVLCKIEGTIDPSDVDAGYFSDLGAPSGSSGS